MTFDNEINLRQDFTDKLDLLQKAIDKVKRQARKQRSTTRFGSSLMKSSGVPGRRVIVVITDGEDTFSRADLQDAIDIAQRTETLSSASLPKAGFLGTVPGVEAGTVKDKATSCLHSSARTRAARRFLPAA
jgi:hypothetical protein